MTFRSWFTFTTKIIFTNLKKDSTVDLVEKKEAALVELLPCGPSLISKACSTESVAQGFLLTRMIENYFLAWPDVNIILQMENPNKVVFLLLSSK